MDFTKPIVYNGLTTGVTRGPTGAPMSGYLLDSFDQSFVDVDNYVEKRALRDGMDASDVYLGRRRIAAIMSVFGSTQGDFWDKSQDLLRAFNPTIAFDADTANLGFLPFDFYQPTADIASWPLASYPNGIPLRYYLRPTATPAYVIRRDSSGGAATLGLSNQYSLSLAARDPGKVAITATSTTGSAINLGDYHTRPLIVIASGSVTGTASVGFTNSPHSEERLLITIDATSTTYTADCDRGLYYKGSTVRMDLLRDGSVFPTLYPGTNVKGSVSIVNAQSTTIFRHTFA